MNELVMMKADSIRSIGAFRTNNEAWSLARLDMERFGGILDNPYRGVNESPYTGLDVRSVVDFACKSPLELQKLALPMSFLVVIPFFELPSGVKVSALRVAEWVSRLKVPDYKFSIYDPCYVEEYVLPQGESKMWGLTVRAFTRSRLKIDFRNAIRERFLFDGVVPDYVKKELELL